MIRRREVQKNYRRRLRIDKDFEGSDYEHLTGATAQFDLDTDGIDLSDNAFAGLTCDGYHTDLNMADFEPYMKWLWPRDRDIFFLRFVCYQTERNIAFLLGLSQAGVSYDLKKTKTTLQYLVGLPKLDEAQFYKDLTSLGVQEVNLVWQFVHQPHQELLGRQFGWSQGRVRCRLLQTVRILKRNSEHQLYVDAIQYAFDHNRMVRKFYYADVHPHGHPQTWRKVKIED